MSLHDKPGALAKIAAILGEAGVSIDRMRQYQHDDTTDAPVLIVTHKTTPSAIKVALDAMQGSPVLSGQPVALRIEDV